MVKNPWYSQEFQSQYKKNAKIMKYSFYHKKERESGTNRPYAGEPFLYAWDACPHALFLVVIWIEVLLHETWTGQSLGEGS